jgi:hypothetical protein
VAQVAFDLAWNANPEIGVPGLQNRRRDAGASKGNVSDDFRFTNSGREIRPRILFGGIAVSQRGESWLGIFVVAVKSENKEAVVLCVPNGSYFRSSERAQNLWQR